MIYSAFLDELRAAGWTVPNKSFATRLFGDGWQVAFVRLGGRYQLPGQVSFVVCIRHISLRDREKEHHDIHKDPHDYPFKLTLEELASENLQYSSKLLHYDLSHMGTESDWSGFFAELNYRVPMQLARYSKSKLREELDRLGTKGFIEKIWAED
ncbi:MAG: hypothetical protein WAX77_05840, partial [Methylococcaceae bacterium]